MTKSIRAAVFILWLSALSAHSATILYSNLVQPGDQYGPDAVGIGHTPAYPGTDGLTIAATRFTLDSDARFTSFQVPVDVRSGPNELAAYLMTEENGRPGAIIEAFALAGLPPGFPPSLTTIDSTLRPQLTANTSYWLALTGGPGTFGGWTLTLFQGVPFASSDFATSSIEGGVQSEWIVGTGGSTAREGALVVMGDTTPEPRSSLLIAGGFLLLLGVRKRRH